MDFLERGLVGGITSNAFVVCALAKLAKVVGVVLEEVGDDGSR